MKNRWHGKKSIFVRWFISYIILLLVIVAVSSGVYLYSYHTITEQSVQMNESLLGKLQAEIDRRFSETRSLINSLLLDTDIQKTVKINGNFQVSDREVLYRIYNNLMAKCASYESVSSLMVYFAHEDTLVSEQGHMSSDLFHELYYAQEWEDAEGMKDFLQGQWNGQIESICNGKGEMELWFLQNSLPRGNEVPRATLVATVADSQLRQWMEDIKWEEDMELFLATDTEILSASSELWEKLRRNELQDAQVLQKETITLDGARYLLAWQPSETTRLVYGMLLPINYAQTGARSIQMFMIAGTALCLLLGLGISYALSGIHYSPLKNLLDTFGDFERRKNEDCEKNEFQWLTDKVNQMLLEQKEIRGQYHAKERSLRQQYLYRLLTYLYDDRADWVQDVKKEGLLCRPYNLVALLFQIHSDTFDAGLLRFVVSNVLQELMEGDSSVEVAETGDSYAVIFNVEEPGAAMREQLENVLEQMKGFLLEYAGLDILISCGDLEEGMEGIHLSYQKAREAGNFVGKFRETQEIIWYEDIRNRYTLFDYSIESEQRIINAIRAGEAEQACLWIREVVEENFCRRELIPNMKICLFYELYGTVTKGAEEGGCGEYIEQLETGLIEVNRMSAEEIIQYLGHLIQEICRRIRQKEERSDRRLGDRVMKYVQEHYQNPDLNISITALYFNLTPSYLSALFREQTGISLLEYINRTRVERARELLVQGCTVAEVCTKTGFGSSGAFIRVFKRITGITPGQMKKCDMDTK